MAETLAHFRYFRLPEHAAMPRVFAAIEIELAHVLDLRQGAIRQRLRVSRSRMMADDWRQSSGRASLTQALGWAAFATGIEGILVPSAARPRGSNLIVFPANLRGSSVLRALPG